MKSLVLPGLAHLTIHSCLHLDARPGVNINAVGDDGADRAESVEAFGASPLAVFVLEVARGEVVDAGVAENVGTNVFTIGEPMAATGDHDTQFALVVGASGNFGAQNRSPRR